MFFIRHLSFLCLCRVGSGLPGLQPGPSLKRAQATASTPCWPLPEKGTDHIRYLAFLSQIPWPYKTKDRGITGRLPVFMDSFSSYSKHHLWNDFFSQASELPVPVTACAELGQAFLGTAYWNLSLKRAQATAPTPCWPLPEKGTDHIRYLAFLCQIPF